jgi:hypothetical protein
VRRNARLERKHAELARALEQTHEPDLDAALDVGVEDA